MKPFKYKAFISYSRKDIKFAVWLFKKLDSYTMPSSFLKENPMFPKKLGRFFRDMDELSAHTDLGMKIKKELRNSEYLIVVCSTDAAQSFWVNEEIKYFKSLGRQNNIIPIIINGEPNATTNSRCNPKDEAYPEALRFGVDKRGNITNESKNPLAPDIRPAKDSKAVATIKIITKLINVDFDTLWKREKRRALKYKTLFTLVGILFFIVLLFSYQKWNQEQSLLLANKQISSIEKELVQQRKLLTENLSYAQSQKVNKRIQQLEEDIRSIRDLQKTFGLIDEQWAKEAKKVYDDKGVDEAISFLNSKESVNAEKSMLQKIANKSRIKAKLYIVKHRYDDASLEYEKAISYFPTRELLFEYAVYADKQANAKKAQTIYLKTLQLHYDSNNTTSEVWMNEFTKIIGNLAKSYKSTGNINEAISLQELSLQTLKSVYSEEKEDILKSYIIALGNLGLSYRAVGRVSEAKALAKEAFRLSKRLYEKNKDIGIESYIVNLNDYATYLTYYGDIKQAIYLEEESMRVLQNEGSQIKDKEKLFNFYMSTLTNLSSSYVENMQIEKAIAIKKELIKSVEKVYEGNKKRHLDLYIKVLLSLTNTYLNKSSGSEELKKLYLMQARILSQKAVEILKPVYNKNQSRWLSLYMNSLSMLNVCYVCEKNYKQGMSIGDELLKIVKVAYENNKHLYSKNYIWTLSNLARTYSEVGKEQQAIALSTQALELAKVLYEKEGNTFKKDYFKLLFNRVVTYMTMGKIEQGKFFEKEMLEMLQKTYKEDREGSKQLYIKSLRDLSIFYEKIGNKQRSLYFQQMLTQE